MKHVSLFFLIGVMCWLANSCTFTSRTYPYSMRMAMDCMESQPDSALMWLQGMSDSLDGLPEETRMYHALLTLQAEDKQYIIHTDDSLITRVVEFYQTKGDVSQRVLAYFMMGKVYIDMNDAPRALKALQQALDFPGVGLDMKKCIYATMSPLFSNQGLNDKALKIEQELMDVHRQQGDLQGMMMSQRDIARLYELQEENDSAILHYKEACRLALEMKDSSAYYGMRAEWAGLQYESGKDWEMVQVLRDAELREDIMDKSYIHFILGQLYKDRQMWDSLAYYSRKVIESGNIEKAYFSYKDLYELEKRNRNYGKALEYMEKAMESRNLLLTISQREAVAQISTLYNYQHISDENAKLKLNKERQNNVILILALLLTLIILVCFAFISFQRKRARLALEHERKLKLLVEERYAKSREAVDDNEKKIERLTKLLVEAQQENDLFKHGALKMEVKQLQLQNEAILFSQQEMMERVNLFKKGSLYRLFQKASQNDAIVVGDEDWEQLEKAMDYMYPNLNKYLDDVFPVMPELTKQLCWLAKMGISPAGSGRILKRSRQAITNARSKLNKIVADSSLPDKNFDDFIANLS